MIDTRFDGDPADCRRAAGELRALASAWGSAGASLSDGGGLTGYVFSGRAGDRFRDSSARAGADAEEAATGVGALGLALHDLADGIAEVEQVLLRAREVAAGRLELRGTAIALPADPTDDQRRVYAVLARHVARARAQEALVQGTWRTALARHAEVGAPVHGPFAGVTGPWPPTRWPDAAPPRPDRPPAAAADPPALRPAVPDLPPAARGPSVLGVVGVLGAMRSDDDAGWFGPADDDVGWFSFCPPIPDQTDPEVA